MTPMKAKPAAKAPQAQPPVTGRALSNLVLGAGFALTGAGTVMLGVLLPRLSAAWGMRDDVAGTLFFLQFLGSSLGAVLAGKGRAGSLIAGYALLAVSACALGFGGRQTSFLLFLCFGAGLGLSMTATSILVSERYPSNRAIVLERLNFAWSAGASAGPILFIPFLRMASLRPLFFVFATVALAVLMWILCVERRPGAQAPERAPAVFPQRNAAGHALLLAMAFCSVGVEAALSGWLTTYLHRADLRITAAAGVATSLFWLGLMVSRLAFSTRLLNLAGRGRLLKLALWGVLAAAIFLVAAPAPSAIRIAAAAAGFCIGPVYPLLLSYLLERTARGWIFAVAGIGSALLPWMTGVASAQAGSLRAGLAVPGASVALMIVLAYPALRMRAAERDSGSSVKA